MRAGAAREAAGLVAAVKARAAAGCIRADRTSGSAWQHIICQRDMGAMLPVHCGTWGWAAVTAGVGWEAAVETAARAALGCSQHGKVCE